MNCVNSLPITNSEELHYKCEKAVMMERMQFIRNPATELFKVLQTNHVLLKLKTGFLLLGCYQLSAGFLNSNVKPNKFHHHYFLAVGMKLVKDRFGREIHLI